MELEHKLREIENNFIALRNQKLQKHRQLTANDRQVIALFVSTMYARTKFQRDIQKEIWQELLDSLDNLPEDILSEMKEIGAFGKIQKLQEQPMPNHLFNFVNIATPILLRMNCAIYETNTIPGFITSDNPCLWIDPAILYPGEPVTWFGLGSQKLNVLLPISPSQCISLKRRGFDDYCTADDMFVDAVESLLVSNTEEHLIVNQNLIKESWYSTQNSNRHLA